MKLLLDEESGLYIITVGDVNSEYYRFATMFNRLTNKAYSEKTWRSVNLMRNILGNLKKDYLEEITSSISQHSFDENVNHEYDRHI